MNGNGNVGSRILTALAFGAGGLLFPPLFAISAIFVVIVIFEIINSPSTNAKTANTNQKADPPARGALDKFNNIVKKCDTVIAELNDSMSLKKELAAALQTHDIVAHAELTSINSAMGMAEFDKELNEWKQEKPGRAEDFEETVKQLNRSAEQIRLELGEVKVTRQEKLPKIGDFPPLPTHADPTVNEAIKRGFSAIVEQRQALFEDTRKKLQDKSLYVPFKAHLERIGRSDLLERIYSTDHISQRLHVDIDEWLREIPEMEGGSGDKSRNKNTPAVDNDLALHGSRIPFLIHFTRVKNLESILRNGLMSINEIHAKGIAAHKNDPLRLDKRLDGISLSVSFPNYKMFYKYRMEFPLEEWVILIIDSDVISKKRCCFFNRNAADHRLRDIPQEDLATKIAFLGMFAEIEGLPTRQEQQLMDHDPTDPQAEIMAFERIEPDLITGVVFNKSDTAKRFEHLRGKKTWQVDAGNLGFFGTREYSRLIRR